MATTKPATLYTALVAAQQAMGPVVKSATNPAFRSKYADLDSVLDAVRGPLNDAGLVLMQPLQDIDGRLVLRTVLIHGETGEMFEASAEVRCADPDNPQKMGGAITYYRRYSILALLGLAPEDDDGQMASQPRPVRNAPVPRSLPQDAAQPPDEAAQDEMDLGDTILAGFLTNIEHAKSEKELETIGREIKRSRLSQAERESLRDPFIRKQTAFAATA